MKTLISIDPGKSTGIAVGTYSDTEPFKLTHVFQIEGGVEGFLEKVTSYYDERGWPEDRLEIGPEVFDLSDTGDKGSITVIAEKFSARGSANKFAYKTGDLEPLRVEGAILALGITPTWVSPASQYFAGGESNNPTTNAHRWLKANGLHVTGKDVNCKDANDARSAILHCISYLRRQNHIPTLQRFFGSIEV